LHFRQRPLSARGRFFLPQPQFCPIMAETRIHAMPPSPPDRHILEESRTLLHRQNLGVLATHDPAQGPHTSLMAYVTRPDQDVVWLISPSQSKKISNLRLSNQASLLVDTRQTQTKRAAIHALTANGTILLHDALSGQQDVIQAFIRQHPQLTNLLQRESLVVMELRIQSYLLLRGPTGAAFVELPPSPGL